jgi:predicted nucleic acid-binding Zn ribbon protein
MRRAGPRTLEPVLGGMLAGLRPATTLARVQEVWPRAVGPAMSAEAQPVSERRGTVTVTCRSSVWAQELQLMSSDLVERLNRALEEGAGGGGVEALRFVAASRPSRSVRRR